MLCYTSLMPAESGTTFIMEVNMNNDYNCADFDLDKFDLGADVSFDQALENHRMADIVLSGWGNDSTCWI